MDCRGPRRGVRCALNMRMIGSKRVSAENPELLFFSGNGLYISLAYTLNMIFNVALSHAKEKALQTCLCFSTCRHRKAYFQNC